MITIVLVIYCPLVNHPKLSGWKQKQIILLMDSAGEVFASGIMGKAYFCCILSGPRLGSIEGSGWLTQLGAAVVERLTHSHVSWYYLLCGPQPGLLAGAPTHGGLLCGCLGFLTSWCYCSNLSNLKQPPWGRGKRQKPCCCLWRNLRSHVVSSLQQSLEYPVSREGNIDSIP